MTRQQLPSDDDGRTIADMSDVRASVPFLSNGMGGVSGRGGASESHSMRDVTEELADAEERLAVIMGALRAALSIWMVYVIGFAIAIMIMLWIWT